CKCPPAESAHSPTPIIDYPTILTISGRTSVLRRHNATSVPRSATVKSQVISLLTSINRARAPVRDATTDVRFGSLADILTSPRHVRFHPNNGRLAAHPSQHLAVGL